MAQGFRLRSKAKRAIAASLASVCQCSIKYTSNGNCVECQKNRRKDHKRKIRQLLAQGRITKALMT